MPRGAWKKVTHIETRVGARGGRTWLLTLECGHLKAKGQPSQDAGVFIALGLRRGRITAPERARCLICQETS